MITWELRKRKVFIKGKYPQPYNLTFIEVAKRSLDEEVYISHVVSEVEQDLYVLLIDCAVIIDA